MHKFLILIIFKSFIISDATKHTCILVLCSKIHVRNMGINLLLIIIWLSCINHYLPSKSLDLKHYCLNYYHPDLNFAELYHGYKDIMPLSNTTCLQWKIYIAVFYLYHKNVKKYIYHHFCNFIITKTYIPSICVCFRRVCSLWLCGIPSILLHLYHGVRNLWFIPQIARSFLLGLLNGFNGLN